MLIDPEEHKERHAIVKPLFSVKSVEQLAPVALTNIAIVIEKMKAALEKGTPVDITRLYRALTIDTIMRLLFDKYSNLLRSEEEEPEYLTTMRMFADNFLIMKHFPILAKLSVHLPEKWAIKLVPGYVPFRKQSSKWLKEIERRRMDNEIRTTYFDLLLSENKARGPRAFSEVVLIDEALAMCFAGTDTTGFALSLGTFYLLKNPTKLRILREELDGVAPNGDGLLEYRDVRSLPYFTAVIKEILRLSSPVPGIIPRRVPQGGSKVAGYYLAPGTTTSVSIRMINYNPDLYPEPNSFIPERWLGPEGKELDKWFLTFSRGSRACIGQKWFDMTLYQTDEKTVDWKDSAAARLCNHVKVTVDAAR
ncbi:hypothetical protein DL764_001372 [Monosporascus ibericus]|uniref:Cytochrome P450 n=1 Tax=Monosporascus ibericus TaxID=155417 RepID=A0A4Q4TPW6_9PEZI|nr:hypothetical protein DL764_001372 [Monosporascus ibericus]